MVFLTPAKRGAQRRLPCYLKVRSGPRGSGGVGGFCGGTFMRIPRRKLYRAFPELDRFSDAECERWVRCVRDAAAGSEWVIAGGIIGAVVATFYLVGHLLALLPSGVLGTWVSRVPKEVALVITVSSVVGL